MAKIKSRFSVAPRVAKYKALPANKTEIALMDEFKISYEFKAYSVGNCEGQAAIFPIDDFGQKMALQFASSFAAMLNEKYSMRLVIK